MNPSTLERISRGLESSLDFWGILLTFATCLVVAGLILEYWSDVAEFLDQAERPAAAFPWAKAREMLGAILVTVGVAGELFFTFEASSVETKLRNNNHQIVALLTKEAGDAKQSAEDAAKAASRAKESSDAAGITSNEAKGSASTALTRASAARAEADSFEKDIKSANENAADAESHLADALKRAAAAQAELNLLKTPRSLTNVAELASELKQFAGTEYTFSQVDEDPESVELLKQIDSLLQLAGWKRVKPSPSGDIVLNVYGKQQDFAVSAGVSTGVEVAVDAPVSAETLNAMPRRLWLRRISVGGALKNGLAACITPASDRNVSKDLVVQVGSSEVIRISVGKKP